MIKKLTKENHEQVMKLILPEASINLFILGDIEMYGYETDFQELWGDFDHHGHLRAVLLRYYTDFIVYGLAGYDAQGFVSIINGYDNHNIISGKQAILKGVQPYLKGNYENRGTYFLECRKETLKLSDEAGLRMRVKVAKPEDASRLVALLCSIESFTVNDVDEQEKQMAKSIEDRAGRCYFIEEGGQVVSMISSAAENTKSAMLIGVCTAPDYRMRGFATAIMSCMLQDLFKEKESVCLFYDNPKAGCLYQRSGFVELGIWTMLKCVS